MFPYDYDNNLKVKNKKLIRDTQKQKEYYIEFQSGADTGHEENGIVKGEFVLPKTPQKTPLAILVHGMGDQSRIPCRLIARSLVKRGTACFIPYLTIHSRRMPSSMKKVFPNFSEQQWFDVYRISVIDICQILDWAEKNDDIQGLDLKKTTVIGVSFGGIVSAIAMGIDERIRAGVFITVGGNSSKLSHLSRDRRYQRGYTMTQQEYQEKQSSYNRYLKQVLEKGVENVKAPNRGFLLDPMTYAGELRQRPVLLINAKRDKYIPQEAALDFWEAMGKPPIKWLPSGHTSIWLFTPGIIKTINEFLITSGILGR